MNKIKLHQKQGSAIKLNKQRTKSQFAPQNQNESRFEEDKLHESKYEEEKIHKNKESIEIKEKINRQSGINSSPKPKQRPKDLFHMNLRSELISADMMMSSGGV